MPYMFMAGDTLVLIGICKVVPVRQERLAVGQRPGLQFLVTRQTCRVIHIALTFLPVSVPINIIWVLDQLHSWINDTVNTLNPEIMQRVVMGDMALAATGSPACRIVAAVKGVAIGAANGRMRVASRAELVVAGKVYSSINNSPAGSDGHT